MDIFIDIFFLFIIFPLSTPQCLTPSGQLNCFSCDFLHSDTNYPQNMKLQVSKGLFPSATDCFAKNTTFYLSRKILILNPSSSNIFFPGYDQIYNDSLTAFQEESKILNGFLYSEIEFSFYPGQHFILRSQVLIAEEELFRRALVNIIFKSMDENNRATLILKTNEFYIFISKSLVLLNLDIFGNDILLQNGNDPSQCYNLNKTCCFLQDFNQNYSNISSNSCSLINLKLNVTLVSFYYGLFNLEYVFDNNNSSDYPNATIINCTFQNFFPLNLSRGWNILFSMAPLGGILIISQSVFDNVFFPNGLIYYNRNQYDKLYSSFMNYANFTSYETNFQNISIVNSIIKNYNLYNIDNSLNNGAFLINFVEFKGNFDIEGSNFQQIFNCSYIFSYSSSINSFSTIIINNSTFQNMSSVGLFYMNNNNKLFFQNSNISLISNTAIKMLLFQAVQNVSFLNNTIVNIRNPSLITFSLINCQSYLNNSIFQFTNQVTLLSANGGMTIIGNCSFQNSTFVNNIFSIVSQNYSLITNSLCEFINGSVSLLYISGGKNFSLEKTMIRYLIAYSVYYLEKLSFNYNNENLIMFNTLTYFWKNDETCQMTQMENSHLISNSIHISVFQNLAVPHAIILCYNVRIINNTMGVRPIMKITEGVCNLTNVTIMRNFYPSSSDLHYVFSFESNNVVYISNSLFKDNGCISRKVTYWAAYEGALINLWSLTYSYLNNNTFISSSVTELGSGFISSSPHGGILVLYNSKFIILETNPNFRYKGILLDHFITATIVNNTFINLMCNNLSFIHMQGSLSMVASASYSYSQNNYAIYMENNSFFNCSCINGGGMGIISIYSIVIKNCQFYNSTASKFSGHILAIAGQYLNISEISMDTSLSDEGSGMYLRNFLIVFINNISIKDAYSRKNGVVFCRDIQNLTIHSFYSKNTFSLANGGFASIFHSNVIMTNITILNSSALISGGSFIILGNCQISLTDCIVIGSRAGMGGFMNIDAALITKISNVSISNVFSNLNGAAFYVNSITSFQLTEAKIQNGTSNGNGGIAFTTDDENVPITLSNVICNQTSAVEGSCVYFLSSSKFFARNLTMIGNGPSPIYMMWSFEITVVLTNIYIGNSKSSDLLLFFSGIKLFLEDFYIFENTAAANFFYLLNTTFFLQNVTFIKNKGQNAFQSDSSSVFIQDLYFNNYLDSDFQLNFFSSDNSELDFENIEIIQSFSPRNAHSIITNGFLNILNASFQNNQGLVFYIEGVNMTMQDCSFFNNTSIDPTFPNEFFYENIDRLNVFSIMIKNTVFKQFSGFSLSLQGGLVIFLSHCNFENALNSSEHQVFSIKSENCFSFSIYACFFSKFTSSALQFLTSQISQFAFSKIDISFSRFANISGNLGSAIYFKGTFQASISNSEFTSNSVFINKSKNDMVQGIAACIFFKSENYQLSQLTLTSNSFSNNYAEYLSPVLFAQVQTTLTNNTFINNFDGINFTTQVSSYPLGFSLSKTVVTTNITNLIEVASGNDFSLELEMRDSFGNLLIFDNSSVFTLKEDLSVSDSSILVTNGLGKAKYGIITFPFLNIKTTPNSTFQLTLSGSFLGLLNNDKNEILKQDLSLNLNFLSRSCLIGEIITADSSCQKCVTGSFSLIDPMVVNPGFQKCYDCPPNTKCYGGSSICPLAGYYRKYNTSNNVAPCLNQKACLGCALEYISERNITQNEIDHGMCAIGNEGVLCFYCSFNYGKYDKTDYCLECASLGATVIFRLIFYGILMILYILMNFHTAENVHKKGDDLSAGTLIKIVINHSQHISIILLSTTKIPFPSFNSFFNQNDYFSFSNDQVITNDCLVQKIYFDPETNVIFKEVFNTILPICFSIFAFTVWILTTLLMGTSEKFKEGLEKIPKSLSGFLSKTIIFVVLSTFVFYALIVKSCFGLFDCMTIDQNESSSFLRESPAVECWTGNHIRYVLFFGLPGLLIWGILFPLFLFIVLKKNYNFMTFANNSGAESIISRLDQYKAKSQHSLKGKINVSMKMGTVTDKKSINTLNNLNINSNVGKQDKTHLVMMDMSLTSKTEQFHEMTKPQLMDSKFQMESSEQSDGKLEDLLSTLKKGKAFQTERQKEKFIENYRQNLAISKTFVFFYKDYRPNAYYWECLIFFRKFILSFFSSLSHTMNNEGRITIMFIILFVFFEVTRKKQPYKDPLCTFVELLSMIICLIAVFSSGVFESDSDITFQNFVAVVCIGSNMIFFLFAFAWIVLKFKTRFRKIYNKYINSVAKKYTVERPKKVINLKNIKKMTVNAN